MSGAVIAVGGGRGFIGRAVAAELRRAGAEVIAFGREGMSEETCAKVQVLVWAAGGREGGAAALEAVHVTAPLQAMAGAPGLRRVMYVSSAEAYGAAAAPFHEELALAGTTPYALAKIAGEAAVTAAARERGIAAIVVRPGVVYGPGQREGMLIPSLLAALRAGRRFPTTAGRQTRDFIHVDDVARLVRRCCEADAPAGIYNAGTGIETPVADVVTGLAGRLGRADLVEFGALEYRAGEVMRYVLDPSRAQARLGFTAAVSLAEGLDRLACPEEQVRA